MTVYIVTYDLNREAVRPNILGAIKSRAWAKLSESSYAIDTQETSEQVYADLRRHIDNNDNLFVIPMTKPYSGFGPKDVIEWLEARLPW